LILSWRVPASADRSTVDAHLPLKPLVFQILLAVADEDRHGWSLVREVQQRGGFARLMPGNFYRTLRAMLADGLLEPSPARPDAADDGDERRRYFRLTAFGSKVAAAEAARLADLVVEARAKRLIARPRS
jgi:DNA-binding PadR family transcriptional regulator